MEAVTKAANVAPEPLPPAEKGGKKASAVYKNVKVLGDLTENEFNRVMLAITTWVAPDQGCTFCHNAANFADDSLYQKVVARKMIQMTTTINSKWQAHVGNTGVTCYTCHRGNNVPNKLWFTAPEVKTAGRMLGNDFGQNKAGQESVKNASLPYDPFTPFLLKDTNIRVAGTTALPTGNKTSLKQAEYVHGLMIHMSDSLGANCTTCHNPHGTVNDKMLKARNQTLCLQCHYQQQTVSGQLWIGGRDHASFVSRGTCWSAGCHEAIHGSHVSSSLRF